MASKKFARLLREYESAVRSDEVKGGGEPDSFDEIEEALDKAKNRLLTYVEHLEANQREDDP